MSQVKVEQLPFFIDARGWLQQGPSGAYAYATCCFPGAVKAWHRHKIHTDRLWCVSGLARVVVAVEQIADEAPNGLYDIQEHVIGPLSPKLITIPPGVWHGFEAVGGECVVINCPDMEYDPDDEIRMSVDSIPFKWGEAKW